MGDAGGIINVEEDHVVVVRTTTLQVTKSMIQKLNALYRDPHAGDRPTIHRVSHDVRVDDSGAYEPKIISIGPYHHGKQILQPMEDIKWEYLQDLLGRSSDNRLEKYAMAVSAREVEARARYAEEIGISTHEFVEMLLLDGCFVIEFLLKRFEGKFRQVRNSSFGATTMSSEKRNLPLLRHDLLLLENQIPFFVLETLFEKTSVDVTTVSSELLTFFDLAVDYLSKGRVKKDMLPPERRDRIHHFLHLYHLCLLQGLEQTHPSTKPNSLSSNWLAKKINGVVNRFFIGFLYVLVSFFQLLMFKKPIWLSYKRKIRYLKSIGMIPSATELEESGVLFRRKLGKAFYMDVSFDGGEMNMPLLSLENNTNSEFRNLLAFEQCYPNAGNSFTSYVTMMCNMLDSAGDVAILRRARILENKYGSDKEVAQFFNRLRGITNLSIKKPHYLSELFENLNRYFESDHHKWRAALVHDHFSNPWAILSLVAAVVLLVLTALQTLYTVWAFYKP